MGGKTKTGSKRGAAAAPAAGRQGRPKGTGSQIIYTELRRRILRLELAPGADLDEQALVSEFKLSRTPVREALLRLGHDELVEIIPNRGARVAALHFHEVAEIFDALEIASRVTARWAALGRTPAQLEILQQHGRDFADAASRRDFHRMTEANQAFHLAIADIAGNRHITRMLATLLSMTFRYAYMTLSRGASIADAFPRGFPQIIHEHQEMVDLIAKGDADAIDDLAAQHTRLFRAKVVELLNVGPARGTPLHKLDRRPRAAEAGARISPRRTRVPG